MNNIYRFSEWLFESKEVEFTPEPDILSDTVTLKKGMTGEKIRQIQEVIKPTGRKGTPLITGNFWVYTDQALKKQFPEYQTERGVTKSLFDKIVKSSGLTPVIPPKRTSSSGSASLNTSPKPESSETYIQKNYNFYPIPDGLGTNYRSAQLPLADMERVIKKYGIKNVIRFNGDTPSDGRHTKKDAVVTIAQEKNLCEKLGCNFHKLSSTKDQDKVNQILSMGSTLIHCAHGADRTGGNVGGYFYQTKPNPNLVTTEQIWKYTTQYNGWNSMAINQPKEFYINQASKFGVKDVNHAQQLARMNRS